MDEIINYHNHGPAFFIYQKTLLASLKQILSFTIKILRELIIQLIKIRVWYRY